jgi:hypothetical protein
MRYLIVSSWTVPLAALVAACTASTTGPGHGLCTGKCDGIAGITASDNGHALDHVAANAVDGDVTTYWEGAPNAYPNVLTFDLGAAQIVSSVVMKLPPDPAWATRTQGIEISISEDGASYETLIAETGYTFDPGGGNNVVVPFGRRTARTIRLTFTSNTGAPAGQIAEFEAYTAGGPGRYEAENATLTGAAQRNTNHANFSGSGFVDGYGTPGAMTTFTVDVPNDGDYAVVLRYGNATGAARTLDIRVNHQKVMTTTLPNLTSWDVWAEKPETLTLHAGKNTIAYEYGATDSGNVNLDFIRVGQSRGATLPYEEYEAETGTTNGTLLGPSRTWTDIPSEASGRQCVRLDGTGQFVELESRAPANSIVVRYAIPDAPNGGGMSATISVYVDGVFRQKLQLTSN